MKMKLQQNEQGKWVNPQGFVLSSKPMCHGMYNKNQFNDTSNIEGSGGRS